MSQPPITLYDIPRAEGLTPKAWSPNTWKIRYVLNYKRIPYKTEWVDYPDIEPLCKKLGAPPTEKKPNGRDDHYTLPLISDPATNQVVVDSLPIARYLETAYPDTPVLFPAATDAFQTRFLKTFWADYAFPLFMIIISRVADGLPPRSAEYFRRTREDKFGASLEALNTPREWEKLEEAWTKLRAVFPAEGLLLTGERITYGDIQVAAVLVWARIVCGPESEDWKRMASLNDGFWGRFLAQFEGYEDVDA